MNRIVKLFSIMIIALLCASAVSASTDVDNVSLVELDDNAHVAIDDVTIDNEDVNQNDIDVIDEDANQTDIDVIDEVNDTPTETPVVEPTVVEEDNNPYSKIMEIWYPVQNY